MRCKLKWHQYLYIIYQKLINYHSISWFLNQIIMQFLESWLLLPISCTLWTISCWLLNWWLLQLLQLYFLFTNLTVYMLNKYNFIKLIYFTWLLWAVLLNIDLQYIASTDIYYWYFYLSISFSYSNVFTRSSNAGFVLLLLHLDFQCSISSNLFLNIIFNLSFYCRVYWFKFN